jgi:signal transduction histidine kinase
VAQGELAEPLNAVEELLARAIKSARALGMKLSPPLHEVDLLPALRWLIQDIAVRTRQTIELEADQTFEVADERIRVLLYRSVDEILARVLDPTRQGRVVLRCTREEGLVRIVLLDPEGVLRADGVERDDGIFAVRERLRYLGGSLGVQSRDGLTLTLVAPAGTAAGSTGPQDLS